MPDEISPKPDLTPTHTVTPLEPSLRAAAFPKKIGSPKQSANQTAGSPAGGKSISYADAGVDITSAEKSKQRIKMMARKTFNKQVLSEIGGFGGLFALDLEKFPNPVLVSSADGVGTKLKVAFELGIHHTVGQDLVNHCVNDIAVQGATPLFFLDYLATGKLENEIVETVVQGLSEACRANGCALIGGETAQMPGFYSEGEYDLAGTIIGAVSRDKIVTGDNIQVGDVLVGSAVEWTAYERLLAGAEAAVRSREVWAGPVRQRAEGQDRSGVDADASQLSLRDQEADAGRGRKRNGAHYRRRNYGESAADSAEGNGRGGRSCLLDGATAV